MGHSSMSFLLWSKPPTPTHPILFPWEMWEELWETGGGCHAGPREGGVGENGTRPPLQYSQPRQDVTRINETSPGAEMDYMTSGSPLTKSWNSQSLRGHTRAPRSPGCVSHHFGASLSLTSVFLRGEGWSISNRWVSLETQRHNCAAKGKYGEMWAVSKQGAFEVLLPRNYCQFGSNKLIQILKKKKKIKEKERKKIWANHVNTHRWGKWRKQVPD